MLKAKLLVVGGDAKTAEVKLRLPTVIGRGKEGVTLTLPHQLVSRKHTEIYEQDNYLFVRDLGSLNGTYVNNKRISEPQILKPNELLTLGNVTFRAIYDTSEGASLPESDEGTQKRSQAVTFEEVKSPEPAKTPTKQKSPVAKSPAAKPSPEKADKAKPNQPIAKNQTDKNQTNKAPADKSSQPKVAASATVNDSVEDVPDKQTVDVLDEASNAEGSSKTDRSLLDVAAAGNKENASAIDSGVFALDEEVSQGRDKSISLSSLDVLPDGPAQVSFVGNMNFDGAEAAAKDVEAIELDLGDAEKAEEASESGLGSFLKKLPK